MRMQPRQTIRRKNDATLLESFVQTFDNHIKADADSFTALHEALNNLGKKLDEFRTDMTPVREAFDGVKWSGVAIAKVVSFISLLVGIGYGIKQIFNIKLK